MRETETGHTHTHSRERRGGSGGAHWIIDSTSTRHVPMAPCPCPARSGHPYQRSRRCRCQTPRGRWLPKSRTSTIPPHSQGPPRTPRRTRTRPAPRRRRPAAPPCSSVQTRPPPLASSTSRPAALPTEAFQMHRRGHRSIFPGDSSTDDAGDGSACRSTPCSASFSSNDFLHHHPGPQDGDQQCRAPDSAREAHPLGQHPRARPCVCRPHQSGGRVSSLRHRHQHCVAIVE